MEAYDRCSMRRKDQLIFCIHRICSYVETNAQGVGLSSATVFLIRVVLIDAAGDSTMWRKKLRSKSGLATKRWNHLQDKFGAAVRRFGGSLIAEGSFYRGAP